MENLDVNGELTNLNDRSPFATAAHEKLDEFISILSKASLDNESLQDLQRKFNESIRLATESTAVQRYVREPRSNGSGEDSDLDQLLFINQLDIKKVRRVSASQLINRILRMVIAILLILLGFGMIIMPAPPYFEMFTLFYLSPNDGVTIMDVVSLIVAFTGVYLLVGTLTRGDK